MRLKAAASIIVVKPGMTGGLFLAASRRNRTDRWGLPGGKVDPGETVVDAAVRELREETGISVDAQDLVPIYSAICPGKHPDGSYDPATNYWVTTFLYDRFDVADYELQPEEGITLTWLMSSELSSPRLSPFAAYNTPAFAAFNSYSAAAIEEHFASTQGIYGSEPI